MLPGRHLVVSSLLDLLAPPMPPAQCQRTERSLCTAVPSATLLAHGVPNQADLARSIAVLRPLPVTVRAGRLARSVRPGGHSPTCQAGSGVPAA